MDLDGSEHYTIFLKDLRTGQEIEKIEHTGGSVEWFNDNKTIWYNTLDDIHRSDKIFRHVIGAKQQDDTLIYHEKDKKFSADIFKSNSESFLFIETSSTLTCETYFISTDNPLNGMHF